jgi:hypothetical protein
MWPINRYEQSPTKLLDTDVGAGSEEAATSTVLGILMPPTVVLDCTLAFDTTIGKSQLSLAGSHRVSYSFS